MEPQWDVLGRRLNCIAYCGYDTRVRGHVRMLSESGSCPQAGRFDEITLIISRLQENRLAGHNPKCRGEPNRARRPRHARDCDMDTMNVGIIGAGGIAQKLHLPDIARTPGLRVTCLAGRKEHRLRSLAERFDVPRITTDFEALLADDSIQGVVIATPHPLHVRYGLEALKAGKHVFMQKPLCGDMDEANAF